MKTLLVFVLAAFGIVVPVPDFIGGLFIGIAVCYGAMIYSPPEGRRSLLATLFVGWLACIMCAIFYPHIDAINWLPLQACMGLAGGLSRPLVESFSSFGVGLQEWMKDLPNKIRIGAKK